MVIKFGCTDDGTIKTFPVTIIHDGNSYEANAVWNPSVFHCVMNQKYAREKGFYQWTRTRKRYNIDLMMFGNTFKNIRLYEGDEPLYGDYVRYEKRVDIYIGLEVIDQGSLTFNCSSKYTWQFEI